jgi:putative DNA primase/helicase
MSLAENAFCTQETTSNFDLTEIASMLGGEVLTNGQILCPGPGHSGEDRSLSVKLDPAAPGGFLIHSFCSDDLGLCCDHVRERLAGLEFDAPDPKPRKNHKPHALALWEQSAQGFLAPVAAYFNKERGITERPALDVVRFHPACPFPGSTMHPAVVCLIEKIVPQIGPDPNNFFSDNFLAIHRIAIDGAKDDKGTTLRRSLAPVKGGAVKFSRIGMDGVLSIGEGVETTLAGAQMGFAPAWSVLSEGGIENFPLLPALTRLRVFGERDKNGANAKAITKLAASYGDKLFIIVPPVGCKDMNDVLCAGLTAMEVQWSPDLDVLALLSAASSSDDDKTASEDKPDDNKPDIIAKAKADVGAPFEPAALKALASLKHDDLPRYMRTLEALKKAGISRTELDKQVSRLVAKEVSEEDNEQGRTLKLYVPEPWPDAVDGVQLLDDLTLALRRYVVMTEEQAHAVALWIVASYIFKAFNVFPRLFIKSPTKRCGKSTLKGVIAKLVNKPLQVENASVSPLFRVIEMHAPTILHDEVDAVFQGVNNNEDLRGLINSGHASVYDDGGFLDGGFLRSVGEGHEPRVFSTFAPMVLVAIKSLPDTIEDRSVIILLTRRLKADKVERFRRKKVAPLLELGQKIARFTADNILDDPDPMLPEALNDRAQDNWRPLVAIADLVGGYWPKTARAAAVKISGESEGELDNSLTLLSDLRDMFSGLATIPLFMQIHGLPAQKETDRMTSAHTVAYLKTLPKWKSWNRNNGINSAQVAKFLKDFKIEPGRPYFDGVQARGYEASQFEDAFRRYL